jgi:hypothetical protein
MEAVVVQFKVLSHHLPAGTEEKKASGTIVGVPDTIRKGTTLVRSVSSV